MLKGFGFVCKDCECGVLCMLCRLALIVWMPHGSVLNFTLE